MPISHQDSIGNSRNSCILRPAALFLPLKVLHGDFSVSFLQLSSTVFVGAYCSSMRSLNWVLEIMLGSNHHHQLSVSLLWKSISELL